MIKIMFLCTANSCRSQMAEGFAKVFSRGSLEVHSAGLMAAGVHHRAVEVMRETGIDISAQESKVIDEDTLRQMDLIVTLCPYAEAYCPDTPQRIKRLYWPIRDPVGAAGSEEEIMNDFRRARDEIKEKVWDLVRTILRSGHVVR